MKNEKIDQLIFSIGVYPDMSAIEKLSLFKEIVASANAIDEPFNQVIQLKTLKKLSPEQKASFMLFYESLDIAKKMEEYERQQVKWVHLFSPEYPIQLKEIFVPPLILFYKGNIQLLEQHTWLGVVGSREYTSYGKQAVETILPGIISQTKGEVGIISGLAKGIDTEAHMTAIKYEGSTIGVIGTGLGEYYPLKNKSLQQFMETYHLVLSEYPLESKPLKFHFPERNRIIAGISRGVLVIESEKSSGSLITAYNAIDEGRDVFAVPGSIFEKNREGNHRLIQLGALLTNHSKDILNEWFYI